MQIEEIYEWNQAEFVQKFSAIEIHVIRAGFENESLGNIIYLANYKFLQLLNTTIFQRFTAYAKRN